MTHHNGSRGSRETRGQSGSRPGDRKDEKSGGRVNDSTGVGGSVAEKPSGSDNNGSGSTGSGSNTDYGGTGSGNAGSGDTGRKDNRVNPRPSVCGACRGIGICSGPGACGGFYNFQPDGGYEGSTDVMRSDPVYIPGREPPYRN